MLSVFYILHQYFLGITNLKILLTTLVREVMSSKRIRDLERLIRIKLKDDPEVAAEIQKKLDALYEEKKESNDRLKEKKHATKYHMVKFFERRKLTRKIKSVDSIISSSHHTNDEVLKELKSQRKKLENDLTYVLYYPLDRKYISILTQDKDSELNQKLIEKTREVAVLEREQDIKNGQVDRVQHAIDVEYGRASAVLPNRGQKKIKSSHDEGSEMKTDKEKEESYKRKRKVERHSAELLIENRSEDDDQGLDDMKRSHKKKSETSTVSLLVDKTEADTESAEAESEAEESKESCVHPADKEKDELQFDPDPFFQEEAKDLPPVPSAAEQRMQMDRALGRGRGRERDRGFVKLDRGSRRASLPKHIDTSKLSKQELRLVTWQSKVRSRPTSGGLRVSWGGQDRDGRKDQDHFNTRKVQNSKALRGSYKDKEKLRATSLGSDRNQRYGSQKDHKAESGLGMGNRNTGTIISCATAVNKKKKFDD